MKCFKALLLIVIMFSIQNLMAAQSINVSNASVIQYTVSNLANASGWGAHISPSASENGYGGLKAECHINAAPEMVTVYCYDGHDNNGTPNNMKQNQYRFDLGPQKINSRDAIHNVEIKIYADKILVKAVKVATNAYDQQQKRYFINAEFIQFRQSSGFFTTGTVYYNVNGVLNGQTDRTGQGFVMSTPVVQ